MIFSSTPTQRVKSYWLNRNFRKKKRFNIEVYLESYNVILILSSTSSNYQCRSNPLVLWQVDGMGRLVGIRACVGQCKQSIIARWAWRGVDISTTELPCRGIALHCISCWSQDIHIHTFSNRIVYVKLSMLWTP